MKINIISMFGKVKFNGTTGWARYQSPVEGHSNCNQQFVTSDSCMSTSKLYKSLKVSIQLTNLREKWNPTESFL